MGHIERGFECSHANPFFPLRRFSGPVFVCWQSQKSFSQIDRSRTLPRQGFMDRSDRCEVIMQHISRVPSVKEDEAARWISTYNSITREKKKAIKVVRNEHSRSLPLSCQAKFPTASIDAITEACGYLRSIILLILRRQLTISSWQHWSLFSTMEFIMFPRYSFKKYYKKYYKKYDIDYIYYLR